MAIGIYFVHEGFTREKYGSAIKQLEAVGAGTPKGAHVPRRSGVERGDPGFRHLGISGGL